MGDLSLCGVWGGTCAKFISEGFSQMLTRGTYYIIVCWDTHGWSWCELLICFGELLAH